jgi:hypothetical protein
MDFMMRRSLYIGLKMRAHHQGLYRLHQLQRAYWTLITKIESLTLDGFFTGVFRKADIRLGGILDIEVVAYECAVTPQYRALVA